MPDPQPQEQQPAPRASEGRWFGGIRDFFTTAAIDIGAWTGNTTSVAMKPMNDARMSSTPGTDMLQILSRQPEFQSAEGKAKLDKVAGDPQFVASLNRALLSDRSIMTTLASRGGQGGTIGAAGMQMINQLQDDSNRSLMTQVLDKVGQDGNDGFGAKYLTEVMDQAQAGDYAALNGTLQQGGISDMRVGMAAQLGPLANIGEFLRNPDKSIQSLVNDPNGAFKSLSEDNKNMLAGLLKAFSSMMGIFMPGQGIIDPYLDLGKRVGGQLAASGAAVRTGDVGTVGDQGNPRAGTSLVSSFMGPASGEPPLGTPPEVAAPVVRRAPSAAPAAANG